MKETYSIELSMATYGQLRELLTDLKNTEPPYEDEVVAKVWISIEPKETPKDKHTVVSAKSRSPINSIQARLSKLIGTNNNE